MTLRAAKTAFLGVLLAFSSSSGAPLTAAEEPVLTCDFIVPASLFLPAQIGDEKGYFLVDNGTPDNVLSTDRTDGIPAADKDLKVRVHDKDLSIRCVSSPRYNDLLGLVSKHYPDLNVLGILGYSFLRSYTVQFDYPGRTLRLHPPGKFPLPEPGTLGDAHVLASFTLSDQGHLFIDGCRIGDSLAGRLHLDLGSPGFNFEGKLAKQAGITGRTIPEFRVDGMSFRDFPWTQRNFLKVFPEFNLIGEIGNQQLLDTVVTLHYDLKKVEIQREPQCPLRLKHPGMQCGGRRNNVTAVTPGSLAEKLGLRTGDKIVSVNGHPTPNPSCMKDAFMTPIRADQASIVVLRDGEETTLSCPRDLWLSAR